MDLSRILSRLLAKGATVEGGTESKADYLIKTDGDGKIDTSLFPDSLPISEISGDLTVGGNLTVQGDTTTLNTQELVVEDHTILLNAGSPVALDAGVLVNRGTGATGASVLWDEADQVWKFGFAGTEQSIVEIAGGTLPLKQDKLINF